MATGVLVISIGEGTKLVPHLTAHDKVYRATLALGSETSTLDAEGEVTETAPVQHLDLAAWQRLADGFLGERPQQVPRVSAVRVDGERLHVRARRGEQFEPPTRPVVLHQVEVLSVEPASLAVRIHCGKGFFVRSFARDLARAAGTRAHLTALRREHNGPFSTQDAVTLEDLERAVEVPELREALVQRMLPLSRACQRVMPVVEVGGAAQEDAFHGRPVALEAVGARTLAPDALVCLLDEHGTALAVAQRRDDALHVLRGFRGVG